MATFFYGSEKFEFNDRTLSHIRTVIISKLMRQESFAFTWQIDGIQRSIWLHPGLHLHFEFESSEPEQMNRAWIEVLAESADTPSGMKLTPEPALEN